ncbi:hypothetical protein NG767_08890 [Aliarcobacter cryaerophilus]|uniref:hypothetical protein n=1 Tax=Aliarcobacter cryaerophilus TaxID=28198 RepID=UPI003DA6070B
MGKVEILTLIAGVVLSIALSLIIVPIFQGSAEMEKRTQIKYEITSLIKHKDLWEIDKTLNFNKSYENYTKGVTVDTDGYIVFESQNKCKVEVDSVDDKFYTIDCKVDLKNKLTSYEDLIENLTKTAYDKKFISGSDPEAKDIQIDKIVP